MSGWILTLHGYDERLLLAVVNRRGRMLDVTMRAITKLGNPVFIIPFTLAVAFDLVPAFSDAGAVAAFALAISHGVVHVLKRRISRERPQLPVGLSFLIDPEDRFSFPSGHAAAGLSVGLPFFLALAGPWALVALVMGLSVGVSRCYLGVHYPSDVVIGWAISAATVLASAAFLGVTF